MNSKQKSQQYNNKQNEKQTKHNNLNSQDSSQNRQGIKGNYKNKGKQSTQDVKTESKQSGYKQNQNQKQNNTMNRKRYYYERDDYYDDQKIEERMNDSLKQFFYYDQEKQKYFRKKDDHKNPIWEGSEVGQIDQIEEVEVDHEEIPFSVYDMKIVEKKQIQTKPRDIIKRFTQKFQLPYEFLYFYLLKDIIKSLKVEYLQKYCSNSMNISQQENKKISSYFLSINEYKAKVIQYDFTGHKNYNLIVLAIKSEQSNNVSFVIISINKYFQTQIIKLVPNIHYEQFLKLLFVQQNQNNLSEESNEQESEEPDYCLYVTKKSIAIFKYEMINIQNIQQSFFQQINLNFEILAVEKYQNNQIIILTKKELTCYNVLEKKNKFKIHFQNYNGLYMRICSQNNIAVVYTESQKLLVICLNSRRILFAKIITNISDFAIINENKNKILFTYQRLRQSLFFIILEKQGNFWNWKKVPQNPLQFENQLCLAHLQLRNQQIQIIQNSVFVSQKTICLYSFDNEKIEQAELEINQQKRDFQVSLSTFFQIQDTLYLIYYNDFQIQIQYSKVD